MQRNQYFKPPATRSPVFDLRSPITACTAFILAFVGSASAALFALYCSGLPSPLTNLDKLDCAKVGANVLSKISTNQAY
ncbi:unnamed protein product [Tilletia controversa]|nr:unnamed protein product [Tilletia controversa]